MEDKNQEIIRQELKELEKLESELDNKKESFNNFKSSLKDTSFKEITEFIESNKQFFKEVKQKSTLRAEEVRIISKIIAEYLEVKSTNKIELEILYNSRGYGNEKEQSTTKVFIRHNGIFWLPKYYHRNERVMVTNSSYGTTHQGIKEVLVNPNFVKEVLDRITDETKKENIRLLFEYVKHRIELESEGEYDTEYEKFISKTFTNILEKDDNDTYKTYNVVIKTDRIIINYAEEEKIDRELKDLEKGQKIRDYCLNNLNIYFDRGIEFTESSYSFSRGLLEISFLFQYKNLVLEELGKAKEFYSIKLNRLNEISKTTNELINPYLALEQL